MSNDRRDRRDRRDRNDREDWEPKTNLGRMVKEGTITDIDEIFDRGLPIMELEIINSLLPDLEEEVMDVNLVQRMHKSGRKVNFRVIVAVGNKNGYVGLGQGKAKEVGPAIRKAVDDAKYNIIKVRRGCGDWGCVCGKEHTVPFKVDDIWSDTKGQTQTTINFAAAVFEALRQLSRVKAKKSDLKSLGVECAE